MSRQTKPHRIGSLVLSAAIGAPPLIAGCAALHSSDTAATTQVVHRLQPAQLAIAQMRRSGETRFELCPVHECPKATPKTLTLRAQALAAVSSDTPSSLPAAATVSGQPAAPTVLPSPSPAPVHNIPPAKTIAVTFASGSALLTAPARRQLEAMVPEAQRSPAIEIRGRTDELGSAALNDLLAHNRALAVRDYLRTLHLPEATTLHLSAKGACCYVTNNDTKEGRAANRRVEIEYQPSMQLARGTPHEPY